MGYQIFNTIHRHKKYGNCNKKNAFYHGKAGKQKQINKFKCQYRGRKIQKLGFLDHKIYSTTTIIGIRITVAS